MPRRVLLSSRSGKDSAWSLHVLRQTPDVEIIGLLTTINSPHDCVTMHSTRRNILEARAVAAGLTLQSIPLPWPREQVPVSEFHSPEGHPALAPHRPASPGS
ncbi:hypothetical protein [Dokdonella sp.]|uniref:hypothetical protein n=1 Tax=Dokdonella sp. TaxID=2291710 RepID=UPI0025BACC5D|nr:hypothetical protein [Dokdonella sp.]MBX3692317.1 hypothetical protein [Dokdonella sp.]MCW5567800.1 hypothetical protein [Dokdonella sp.]